MTIPLTADEVRDARSICTVFQTMVREVPDRPAVRASDGSTDLTWAQYGERVGGVAAGLAALGVGPGDTVAMMLTNRPEFFLVDMAAMHLRAAPFSMYNSSSPEQIEYFMTVAECRVVVCEVQFLDRVRSAFEHIGGVSIVCVDGAPDGAMTFAELEARGEPGFDIRSAADAVRPDDTAALIFTSGTTGRPKAVELTHRNILYTCGSIRAFPQGLGIDAPDARVVSYLPDAHLADRVFAYYLPTTAGASVTTIRDSKTLVQALVAVRPTLLAAVPLIWYRFKAAIDGAIASQEGDARAALEAAIATGAEVVALLSAGEPVPEDLRARHAEAEKNVLAPLRGRLGLDAIVTGISGAAPIAAETLELLMAVGIPVIEGWAMSETSGAGLINPAARIKTGTVGPALPYSEVRIAEDGELLLRSPGVMKGYRNDPERTAEAVDAEGWLHTGDVATVDDDGYVTIIDRKKELIINTAGKTMSPAYIENAVKTACSLIGSIAAIGDGRAHVTALITLDPEASAGFAARNGIEDASPAALSRHPLVEEAIAAGVAEANATLSRVEAVRRYTILPTYWLPDTDILTPTAKLRRRVVDATYAAEIESMYTDGGHR